MLTGSSIVYQLHLRAVLQRILPSLLRMSGRFSRTIYVGNLPADIKEWEVEDLFYKVGHLPPI